MKAPNWLTHIEHDWRSPVWRHWLTALGEHCTVIRYDERGCGLSDRQVDQDGFEFARWLGDLEAVVDTVGPERFTLLGISQGAGIAIAYTVRHPERVSDLILYGGYLRGGARLNERMRERGELMTSAIRTGWGARNPAFRRLFTTLFLPEGTSEQVAWFEELQRTSGVAGDRRAHLGRAHGSRRERPRAAGDGAGACPPRAGGRPRAVQIRAGARFGDPRRTLRPARGL